MTKSVEQLTISIMGDKTTNDRETYDFNYGR